MVKLAKEALRGADMLGRYGGEEFVFFFDGASLNEGIKAANRIRTTISGHPMPLDNGEQLQLNVCFGICCIMPDWAVERDGYFLEKMIKMADDALYVAKHNGRDRVEAAPLVLPELDSTETKSTTIINPS